MKSVAEEFSRIKLIYHNQITESYPIMPFKWSPEWSDAESDHGQIFMVT